MAEQLEYLVQLRGGSEAAAQARALRDAVAGVGGQMTAVGKHSAGAEPGVSRFEKSLRRTALALGAVGAGYAAWNQAKSAIEFTHNLAEGTATLTKATGMSTEASSRWVGVANAIGVSGQAVGTAFTKLATAAKAELTATDKSAVGHEKQTAALKALEMRQHTAMVIAEAAASHSRSHGKAEEKLAALRLRQGTELATATLKQSVASKEGASAFQELGISADFVREHQHDMGAIMETVIEKLDNHLPAGVSKSAVMTKLFGRSWQDLSPLLLEGRKHLDDLLNSAKKFGVELHGDTQQKLEEFRAKQVEAKLAMEGLQLAFTEMAAGPAGEVLGIFSKLALALKSGNWNAFNQGVNELTAKLVSLAEKVMPHVADAFAQAAPRVLLAFVHGFQSATVGGEALIAAAILVKLGLAGNATKAIAGPLGRGVMAGGAAIGGVFVGAFETATLAGMYAWDAVKAFASPKMLTAAGAAGGLVGTAFQVAFAAGLVALAVILGKAIGDAVNHWRETHRLKFDFNPFSSHFGVSIETLHPITPEAVAKGQTHFAPPPTLGQFLATHPHRKPIGGALGAEVMRGGRIEVGERGPEVVNLPSGALVQPLKPGSMAEGPTVIQVDGRELMRVWRRHSYEAAAEGAGSG